MNHKPRLERDARDMLQQFEEFEMEKASHRKQYWQYQLSGNSSSRCTA